MPETRALQYKPDWPEARERMEAFWRGEVRDRPPIWITAPRRNPLPGPPRPPLPEDLPSRYLDQDYLLAEADYRFRHTIFLGESVPCFLPYQGANELALYLGSQAVFAPDTVWFEPALSGLEGGPDLTPAEDNRHWRWAQQAIRRAKAEGEGKFIVSFPDLIENLDTLAALRGTQPLLYDLVDHPAAVHRYQEQILAHYFRYYDRLAALLGVQEQGSMLGGFPMWMPGRGAKVQCDFSAMISPAAYAEFVLPYLQRQLRRLEYSIYHLDGPCALQHLDALLGIPELQCIQWTPGDGHEPCASEHWLPIFRRIQAAGKIVFANGNAADARRLLRQLDRRLLFFSASCEDEDEAYALLRDVERLGP